jgi:capsular polysaccharide biosynthesis protein
MNPVQRPDSFEAADYVGMLRRRWLIILVLAVLGLVAAFGYVTVAPKTYTATAQVNVTPTGADQSNQVANSRTANAAVNLDTEAQIVISTTVATIAKHLMRSSLTPWQLAQQVAVTVPPNSSILDISCSAPTAVGAATCAQDFARAYLQNRSNSAAATLNGQLRTLEAKRNTLQNAASALSAAISALPTNSTKRLADQIQLKTDDSNLHALNVQIGNVTNLLADTSGGSIISSASPPGKPSSPKKALVLPSGLVAGLLVGLLVAFLLDRRDKRIHSSHDAERMLGLPVMLDLPKGSLARPLSLASPRSRTGQAFTELAHAVSAALGEGNHVLMVAGTSPGAGKSVVAANLAATLARIHGEVVLVCADLNGSVSPAMLGAGEDGEGLAELVAGQAAVREVVRASGIQGLWVITPGADPALVVYHLQHDTARALIAQLRRDARYVIIEAQASEEGADTFGLGEFADAALVTIEAGGTRRDQAATCIRRLRQLRTPALGAAVVPALPARISARPPRSFQPSLNAGPGELPPDGAAPVGRGHDELSAVPAAGPDLRERSGRPRDGYTGRPDRAAGN